MSKKMIELPTYLEPIGELKPIEPAGPVAPVSSYGETRGYLQDGRWLPGWLVWLRRRRVLLGVLALAVLAMLARVLLSGSAK